MANLKPFLIFLEQEPLTHNFLKYQIISSPYLCIQLTVKTSTNLVQREANPESTISLIKDRIKRSKPLLFLHPQLRTNPSVSTIISLMDKRCKH